MNNDKISNLEYCLDIQNKIAFDLSLSMPLEIAFSIILKHLTAIEEIEAGAFFYIKPNGTIILEKQINFPEAYQKTKHIYNVFSPESELLLSGKTNLLEINSSNQYFNIYKFLPEAKWMIVSPTRLNGDIVGGLVFVGSKPIKETNLLLKTIENIGYKIGGVIGRIESEKDISEKQKSLENLLQSFHDIIIITNKEGKIIYYNWLLSQKTGYLEEELYSLYIQQLFPEELSFEIKKILNETNNTEKQSHILLYPLLSSNKELIPAETIVSKVVWSGRNMLLWSIRDLKYRKQAEKEINIMRKKAEEASLAKTAFLTNLSFALRIPLSSILGMSELLLKTDLNKNQFNHVNIITRSAEQLMLIANQLLDISKIEKGELFLEDKVFSLKDIVIQVLNQQYFKAYNKGIEIICDYVNYGDDIILKGDALRLSQILQNLIDNAIKFTEKGKVEVNIQPVNFINETIILNFSVKDTGKGMSQETINQILNNCQQKSPISNPTTGDFGLGLIIAYNLIELMGSKLHIESIPAVGSNFYFNLSIKTGNIFELEREKEKQKVVTNFPSTSKISVLVAEDQPFNQIVIQSMLEEWGFDVDVAENGRQVIEKISNKRFDVILMDIYMPEMNGIETTNYIRNNFDKPLCDIPIIAITANAYVEEHQKFIDAGMTDTISKPFKSYLLFNKIINVLGVSKATLADNFKQFSDVEFFSSKEEKLYDLELFKNITKNQKGTMIKMLRVFIEKSTDELNQLIKYTEQQDWEKVSSITHKMKPSFAYLSMKQLENLVQQIHHLAKNKEKTEIIPKLVQNTKNLLEFTIQKLENEITKLS
jgi:hypothetical protein